MGRSAAVLAAVVISVALGAASPASSQDVGYIKGIITDRAGKGVGDLVVRVVNPLTAGLVASAVVKTDADGRFLATVPPGEWDVIVPQGSFKQSVTVSPGWFTVLRIEATPPTAAIPATAPPAPPVAPGSGATSQPLLIFEHGVGVPGPHGELPPSVADEYKSAEGTTVITRQGTSEFLGSLYHYQRARSGWYLDGQLTLDPPRGDASGVTAVVDPTVTSPEYLLQGTARPWTALDGLPPFRVRVKPDGRIEFVWTSFDVNCAGLGSIRIRAADGPATATLRLGGAPDGNCGPGGPLGRAGSAPPPGPPMLEVDVVPRTPGPHKVGDEFWFDVRLRNPSGSPRQGQLFRPQPPPGIDPGWRPHGNWRLEIKDQTTPPSSLWNNWRLQIVPRAGGPQELLNRPFSVAPNGTEIVPFGFQLTRPNPSLGGFHVVSPGANVDSFYFFPDLLGPTVKPSSPGDKNLFPPRLSGIVLPLNLNPFWTAKGGSDALSGSTLPQLVKRSQFGSSVSGPEKDRAFFFYSYQGSRADATRLVQDSKGALTDLREDSVHRIAPAPGLDPAWWTFPAAEVVPTLELRR